MRIGLFLVFVMWAPLACAETRMEVEINVPEIDADPYYKPYVAVWLETSDRQPLHTLALWYLVGQANNSQEDGAKWLKDLRQWWRKVGRPQTHSFDSVTGATRRPGRYLINWTIPEELVTMAQSESLWLHVEAAREEGGRSYQRLAVSIPQQKIQTVSKEGELGEIQLTIKVVEDE